MTTKQQTGVSAHLVDEESVAAYLRSHPEFFANQRELLADLNVPHPVHGQAVSLIERQVALLREQNRELGQRLQALVQVARDNDRLNERMQRLTLALLESQDLEALSTTLHQGLGNDFEADLVALHLFDQQEVIEVASLTSLDVVAATSQDEAKACFDSVLTTGRPLCGHLRRAQCQYLFGDHSEEVGSAVVVPLTIPGPGQGEHYIGLLGIASRDGQRYHAGMGTLFLGYMGSVIGRTLAPYLA